MRNRSRWVRNPVLAAIAAARFARLAGRYSAVLAAAGLAACQSPLANALDGPPALTDSSVTLHPDSSYPPPRTDVVPSVGLASTVDLATWNIENFPKLTDTPERTADLIASLRLDLIAVEEIADVAAFEELVARLPTHDGVLSTHTYGNGTYQKVGFVYRWDLLQITHVTLLFGNEGYIFPRPPLQVSVSVPDASPPLSFELIVVHLKAGVLAEDRARRSDANLLLEPYVRSLVDGQGHPNVIVLGDFNEVLTTSEGRATMAPWLATSRYRAQTDTLANSGGVSFLPSGVLLDHIVSTVALDDEVGAERPLIPDLDAEYANYQNTVSDHVPVVLRLPVLP